MRVLILSLLVACSPGLHSQHPTSNRVCILAAESQRIEGKEGTCDPASSDPATADYAMWRSDGGVKWCHNTADVEHPLACFAFKLTTTDLAQRQAAVDRAKIEADAKAKAEADAKAKIEADAKAAAEADAKAKIEADAKAAAATPTTTRAPLAPPTSAKAKP